MIGLCFFEKDTCETVTVNLERSARIISYRKQDEYLVLALSQHCLKNTCWVSGHTGIEGNGLAVKLAIEGVIFEQDVAMNLLDSFRELKQMLEVILHRKTHSVWGRSTGCLIARPYAKLMVLNSHSLY